MISRGLVRYSVLGHGLGPMIQVYDPTCGVDSPAEGGLILVTGTMATPAGAVMAVVGAQTSPTGNVLPITFQTSLANGNPSHPVGATVPAGTDTDRPGAAEDLGDDLDCT